MCGQAKLRLWTVLLICYAASFDLIRAASIDPALAVNNLRGFPDRTYELSLSLSRATNATALQFDLSFNPATVDRLAPGWSDLLSNHRVHTREIRPGLWRTLVYSSSNALLRPNMLVATLPFHIPANELSGSGPIAPSRFVLAAPDARSITPVTTRQGRIFVSQVSPPDPDGSVVIFFPVSQPGDYVLLASDDFKVWTQISTNSAADNIVEFIDVDAVRFPHRFYLLTESTVASAPSPSIPPINVSYDQKGGTLRISSAATDCCVLEYSDDLKTWMVAGAATTAGETIEISISRSDQNAHRFYRLRSRR